MARAGALLILGTILLRAQTKEVSIRTHPYIPPSAILHAETNLVEAGLTVRDSRGHAIPGLHASDFEVLDNGVPQKITAFSELRSDGRRTAPTSPAAPAEILPPAAIPPREPRFVTFFFDDFHGGAGLFVTKAARAFIAKGLRPGDSMSIVTASGQGDLDFTNDAKLFAEKLNHLATHERSEVQGACGVGATDSYIVVEKLDFLTIEKAIAAATVCACGGGETPSECRSKALPVAEQMASASWEQTQAQSINTIAALGFAAKRLSEVNGTRILVMNSAGFLVRPNQPEMQRFINGAVRWNIVVHAIDDGGLGMDGSCAPIPLLDAS